MPNDPTKPMYQGQALAGQSGFHFAEAAGNAVLALAHFFGGASDDDEEVEEQPRRRPRPRTARAGGGSCCRAKRPAPTK